MRTLKRTLAIVMALCLMSSMFSMNFTASAASCTIQSDSTNATAFTVGSKFSADGLHVFIDRDVWADYNVTYPNEKANFAFSIGGNTIDENYTFKKTDVGTKTVSVNYTGNLLNLTTSYDIEVQDVYIESTTTTMSSVLGEKPDFSSLAVSLINASTGDLIETIDYAGHSGDFSFEYGTKAIDSNYVFTSDDVGSATLTIKYNRNGIELTDTLSCEVLNSVLTADVESFVADTATGKKFDPTGIEISVVDGVDTVYETITDTTKFSYKRLNGTTIAAGDVFTPEDITAGAVSVGYTPTSRYTTLWITCPMTIAETKVVLNTESTHDTVFGVGKAFDPRDLNLGVRGDEEGNLKVDLYEGTDLIDTIGYKDASEDNSARFSFKLNGTPIVPGYVFTAADKGAAVLEVKLIQDGTTYFEDFSTTYDVTIVDVKPETLTVTKAPDVVEYKLGETFDATGLEATIRYSDGSVANLGAGSSFLGILPTAPFTVAGTKDYSVTYSYEEAGIPKTLEATGTVTVEDTAVASIAVTKNPDKTEYIVGQSFDPKGMEVTATYADGATRLIGGYLCRTAAFTDAEIGTAAVEISFEGVTTTVNVDVVARAVTGIKVTKAPFVTDYIYGETFNPAGMEVELVYNDGTTEPTTDYSVPTEAFAAVNKATEVVVTYTADTTITTKTLVCVDNKLIELKVEKVDPANDVTYYVGGTPNEFDKSTIVVTAVYADGTETAVEAKDYTVSPAAFTQAGEIDVVVSFDKKNATIKATVVNNVVESLIATAPDKTEYIVGQSFDPTGMVVTATYSDGTTKEVTGYRYDTTAFTDAEIGTAAVEISFEGVTTTVDVNVVAKVVTGIKVTKAPFVTYYIVGETFNPAGMVVELVYNDGTTEPTTEYTVPTEAFAAVDKATKVVVTYTADTSITTETLVCVDNELKALKVEKVDPANNVTYYVGGTPNEFDKSTIIVTAVYADGTEDTVEAKDYTVSPAAFTQAGEIDVVVSFGRKNATIKATVANNVVESLIATAPDKTDYIVGQSFDPTGMVVTATYSDGTTKEVTGYLYRTAAFIDAEIGAVAVDVKFEGVTTTVDVNVVAKVVTGIKITKDPSVIYYVVGESFIPDGMDVVATYNDGTTAETTDYTYAPTTAFDTAGKTIEVTVTYSGTDVEASAVIVDTVHVHVVKKVATAIKITTNPTKMVYVAGQSFETAGMVLTATYNDDTQEVIPSKANVNAATPDKFYTYIPEEKFTSVGYANVVFSYMDVECTLPVQVIRRDIETITIDASEAKLKYLEGQSFNPSGIDILATMNDGTPERYDGDNCSFKPQKFDKQDDTPISGREVDVTVYFRLFPDGKEASGTVTVKVFPTDVIVAKITKSNFQAEYEIDERVDLTGTELELLFLDDSTVTVTDTSLMKAELVYSDDWKIKVTYNCNALYGTTAVAYSAPVKVYKQELKMTGLPKQMAYEYGSEFNAMGMRVELTKKYFTDGTTLSDDLIVDPAPQFYFDADFITSSADYKKDWKFEAENAGAANIKDKLQTIGSFAQRVIIKYTDPNLPNHDPFEVINFNGASSPTSIMVSVNNSIKSIQLVVPEDKNLTFTVGDLFDASGISVLIERVNGDKETLSFNGPLEKNEFLSFQYADGVVEADSGKEGYYNTNRDEYMYKEVTAGNLTYENVTGMPHSSDEEIFVRDRRGELFNNEGYALPVETRYPTAEKDDTTQVLTVRVRDNQCYDNLGNVYDYGQGKNIDGESDDTITIRVLNPVDSISIIAGTLPTQRIYNLKKAANFVATYEPAKVLATYKNGEKQVIPVGVTGIQIDDTTYVAKNNIVLDKNADGSYRYGAYNVVLEYEHDGNKATTQFGVAAIKNGAMTVGGIPELDDGVLDIMLKKLESDGNFVSLATCKVENTYYGEGMPGVTVAVQSGKDGFGLTHKVVNPAIANLVGDTVYAYRRGQTVIELEQIDTVTYSFSDSLVSIENVNDEVKVNTITVAATDAQTIVYTGDIEVNVRVSVGYWLYKVVLLFGWLGFDYYTKDVEDRVGIWKNTLGNLYSAIFSFIK